MVTGHITFFGKTFTICEKHLSLQRTLKYMQVQHNIVIKNPSKKILDLMAQIAQDKAAKQAELRARWENGTIENVEVVK